MSGFKRLNKNEQLIKELREAPWWKRVLYLSENDKDIHVQIRPKTISVYCRMANLLSIKYENNKLVCEIHYKYLLNERKKPYVRIIPSNGNVAVSDGSIIDFTYITNNLLSNENLKIIKSNIDNYVGEEKGIQSKLVEKNRDTLLDVEAAFSEEEAEKENGKIDIVNYDCGRKKIVFIELKQIFDTRLYNKGIVEQLTGYSKFIENNYKDIIKAYQDSIETKKELGLIKKNSTLEKVRFKDIERKVLLIVAAYNQKFIDLLRDEIKKDISDSALGLYMFGNPIDLGIKSHKNKIIF